MNKDTMITSICLSKETCTKEDFNFKIEYIIKQTDEQINDNLINTLYEMYKNTEISNIYVINRQEFKNFINEMLPSYINKIKN